MPIKVIVELTEPFANLSVYDHMGGDKLLFGPANAAIGPLGSWNVETNGSPTRVGRLLFRSRENENKPYEERLFDVREGVNELPAHDSFAKFARFVIERSQGEER